MSKQGTRAIPFLSLNCLSRLSGGGEHCAITIHCEQLASTIRHDFSVLSPAPFDQEGGTAQPTWGYPSRPLYQRRRRVGPAYCLALPGKHGTYPVGMLNIPFCLYIFNINIENIYINIDKNL
jgi:hypothetical protein